MRFRGTWFLLALGAIAAIWFALDSARTGPNWVRISAAPSAQPGQPFPLRVHLAKPVPNGHFSISLRESTRRSEETFSIGDVSWTLRPGQNEYAAAIAVLPTAPLGYARLTVFLSPTGLWEDRTATASSVPIQVLSSGTQPTPKEPPLTSCRLFEAKEEPRIARVRPGNLRLATTVLWGVAAVFAGLSCLPRSLFATRIPHRDAKPWRVLFALCLSLMALEALDAPGFLGEWARTKARESNAYMARHGGQEFACAIALALLGLAAVAIVRKPASATLRIGFAATALSLGLACLDSVSLHVIDPWLEYPILRVPVLPAVQLLSALTTASVFLASRFRSPAPPPPNSLPGNG